MKTRHMKTVPTSFERISGGFDDQYDLEDEPETNSGGYKPVDTEDDVRTNKLH